MVVETVRVELATGEFWWGGAVANGTAMPWTRGGPGWHQDLATTAGRPAEPAAAPNQSAPLLVSSTGRYLYSDRPFAITVGPEAFEVSSHPLGVAGEGVRLGQATTPTLAGAYREVIAKGAAPSGTMPDEALFAGPQYNTWIELPFTPTQAGVLAYAEAVLAAGLPPGVLMIDDLWARDYGTWEWDRLLFPDPAAMVARLRELGFAVMLWVVPYVSPDSATARELAAADLLLRDACGEVAIRRWWNGWSALLDVSNPAALAWWRERLEALQRDSGVAGFKFDGGDVRDYRPGDGFPGSLPVDHTRAYNAFGAGWAFNEFRAAWHAGGMGLAQRLHDKPATWDDGGLGSLIPEAIAQSLMGYAFSCPDMVGGGELNQVRAGRFDAEQFVRYAQAAALFPMMQFSLNPARVLDGEALAAVRGVVGLRQTLVPEILALAREAAVTGEPILRPLGYEYPGLEPVTDQFLLGQDVLVAPVLERGARRRRVVIPEGEWAPIGLGMPDGVATGGVVELPVELGSLPVWRRLDLRETR